MYIKWDRFCQIISLYKIVQIIFSRKYNTSDGFYYRGNFIIEPFCQYLKNPLAFSNIIFLNEMSYKILKI